MLFVEFTGDEAHARRIIEIQKAVGWGTYRAGPAAFAATHKLRVEEEGLKTYLASTNGAVVGYCDTLEQASAAFGTDEGQAYVLALAVDPAHDGSGAACELGAEVKRRLAATGAKVALSDVAMNNQPMLGICKKLGGELVGPAPERVQHMGRGVPMVRLRWEL